MKLEVVEVWETTFGKKYERLSCGHSRRIGEEPDRTDSGIGPGADSNLPDDRIYCWFGCHEEGAGTDMRLRQDEEPVGANAMIAADPEEQPLR